MKKILNLLCGIFLFASIVFANTEKPVGFSSAALMPAKKGLYFGTADNYLTYFSRKATGNNDSIKNTYEQRFAKKIHSYIDYLPLGGGTLTGTLYGTDASFSGNVGVGIASPQRRLHVHGATNTAVLSLTDASTGSNSNNGLYLGYQGQGYLWNYENTNFGFGTNNAERMTITNAGDIGIGITSPQKRLHVHGATNTAVLSLTDASTGSGSNDGLYLGYQ
jgi:hypothetical protein